jgi:hypothetical protein
VLADHGQQVTEELALALGQVTGDRIERRRRCGAVLDSDPDPLGFVRGRAGRGAVGAGLIARQGSALRLCRYFRPS